MAQAILLPNEFESQNVNFMPPKQNKLGGQNVLLNYKEEDKTSPFILQTCRVRIPFGIDQNKQDQGTLKYHISFSLAHEESDNEQLKLFTENIRKIDQRAKTFSEENDSWFGKKLKPEIAAEFYKSAEKFPKDSKYASTLKVKLPFDRKGKPLFNIYDENRNPIEILDEDGNLNLECIPKGSEAVFLIQPTGVWFMGKTQYGIGYKVVQGKIFKSNKLNGCAIVDVEEELEDDEEAE